jgi:hypothetical protein
MSIIIKQFGKNKIQLLVKYKLNKIRVSNPISSLGACLKFSKGKQN